MDFLTNFLEGLSEVLTMIFFNNFLPRNIKEIIMNVLNNFSQGLSEVLMWNFRGIFHKDYAKH